MKSSRDAEVVLPSCSRMLSWVFGVIVGWPEPLVPNLLLCLRSVSSPALGLSPLSWSLLVFFLTKLAIFSYRVLDEVPDLCIIYRVPLYSWHGPEDSWALDSVFNFEFCCLVFIASGIYVKYVPLKY